MSVNLGLAILARHSAMPYEQLAVIGKDLSAALKRLEKNSRATAPKARDIVVDRAVIADAFARCNAKCVEITDTNGVLTSYVVTVSNSGGEVVDTITIDMTRD